MLPFGGYVKFAGESNWSTSAAARSRLRARALDGAPTTRSRNGVTHVARVGFGAIRWRSVLNYVTAVLLFIGVYVVQGVNGADDTRRRSGGGTGRRPGGTGDTIVSIDGTGARLVRRREPAGGRACAPKAVVIRRDGAITVKFDPKVEHRQVSLGMFAFQSSRVGRVQKDKPAYHAGLAEGSTIEAINDTTVTTYGDLVRIINANAGKPLYIRWTSEGLAHADTIIPEPKQVLKPGSTSELTTVGIIGIHPYSERRREGFFTAISNGFMTANAMTCRSCSIWDCWSRARWVFAPWTVLTQ